MSGTSKLPWQAMTPRERDALVAEKVMGWEPWPEHSDDVDCWLTGDPDNPSWKWFSPTTCPRACAEVIETMRTEGFVVRLDNGLDGTWEATFYKPTTIGGEHYATADTMPEAVCLATLRAVGLQL